MEFRVLGPLEVGGDGQSVELGGVKQRSLLAMLLLHAGEVVSTDRLIDGLWGASPPLRAGKSIQVYVSRLRKTLADDCLITRPHGYVLYVDASYLPIINAVQAEFFPVDPPARSAAIVQLAGARRITHFIQIAIPIKTQLCPMPIRADDRRRIS